jgi:hypothetical protein
MHNDEPRSRGSETETRVGPKDYLRPDFDGSL